MHFLSHTFAEHPPRHTKSSPSLAIAFLGATLVFPTSLVEAEEPLTTEKNNSTYVAEAPLPEGWPEPGPYNEVVEKTLPDYRGAFAPSIGRAGSFWTLFLHIQKHGIPMTAPVEMELKADEEGALQRSSMAFLYQNQEVGSLGKDGWLVEVRNVPSTKVLSYAWQGRDSQENLQRAKEALDRELSERKVQASGFRLLGYNGPSTPREKATWELQAVLP